ncbi:hypothetical protein DOTSEDRAFT_21040 [Dothistroma septosporum NZE10]|uniref:F-box domain-containing protein n=1 Tax=Dothistroma septosporum (strain NZE10 / CBS 128990) TaxID=675120 RepID=N1PXX7_DOTSN|nr:hypothetical protein DOTSEDRAFT_21040 [Dothistroma septosporum NZE10]
MAGHIYTANLLSLPRELRDLIYSYVTEAYWHPSPPPLTPSDDHKGLSYYPSEHSKWQPLSLLSVNHQLRSEILDYISSNRKRAPLTFGLNISIKGYIATPSWTHLNFTLNPHSTLDFLNVNLHIHSTESFTRDETWPQPPGQVFHSLLSLLSRVIFLGPSCLDPSPPSKTLGPHFIKTLSIRIFFHDDYTPDTWPGTTHEIFRNLKTLSTLNTAYRYLGAVRATVAYRRNGEEVQRTAEWEVRPGGQSRYPGGSRFREADWAVMGFRFGESWFEWYKQRQSANDA